MHSWEFQKICQKRTLSAIDRFAVNGPHNNHLFTADSYFLTKMEIDGLPGHCFALFCFKFVLARSWSFSYCMVQGTKTRVFDCEAAASFVFACWE